MKGRRHLALPRRWRIVRNAAATLLLGALAAALDFPVLTQYGTFRRLEEQYLLAPARLVYRLDDPGSGAAFLTQGESWIAVGMVEEFDGTFLPHYSGVITQVLDSAEEHVVVLPMRGEESETAAAAWGMPEEAASAQLELILEGVSYRLTLWDQAGNEVGRRSGTLPENQALRDW